ncbi:hypothetical protein [Kribbella deserti]|uniref:Uncharacterized protein n=1 Tax=Kribbella deserti TaxID=1926257 RepID=A0ABV6QE05_9ACTN
MTNLVRKYIELQYTFAPAVAATIVQHAAWHPNEAVRLFTDDGGITASINLTTAYSDAQTLVDAIDLAWDEVSLHTPNGERVPAPWRMLIVDGDGMADHVATQRDTEAATAPPPDVDDEGMAGASA